jgi:hypothetical protein
MLTDEQIQEKALAYIRRFGDDLRLSRPVTLTDPNGVFFKAVRPTSNKSTNLVSPFIVLREDGRIVPISAGDVMPGVVTKLWGWAAMRADPELMKAVVDPDFEAPRHVEVWSQIIREVMTSKSAR